MTSDDQNSIPNVPPAQQSAAPYDALLIVSYGGPEGPEEVRPFLENVLRGRNVSQQQFEAAAAKYHAIGGASPVNEECRSLIGGLLRDIDTDRYSGQTTLRPQDAVTEPHIDEIFAQVKQLPIYWGNLFWHPLLEDTIAGMAEEGIRRVIAFCTVPFGTEHSTRSYNGAIDAAVTKAGIPDFVIQQTRLFYNHPLFISTMADRLTETLLGRGTRGERRGQTQIAEFRVQSAEPTTLNFELCSLNSPLVLFTAHSVPVTDAQFASYQSQMQQACSLVADAVQLDRFGIDWDIAWQSRGGSQVTGCEPDVVDYVKMLLKGMRFPGKKSVIVCPIGFMLENMELLYDLDVVIRQFCELRGLNYDRTPPVSGHRKTIAMIRELVAEVYSPLVPRRHLG